jgi:transcription factor RLM1
VSALPSRFLNNEFLPSPSSFYPEWDFSRNGNSNTLPSPLNFATPVVGTGPSFLRDENPGPGPTSGPGPAAVGVGAGAAVGGGAKRKTPEAPTTANPTSEAESSPEMKRLKRE